MATDFQFDPALVYDVNIKVVGVGGGGGNALNCMINAGVGGVDYIAMNTDARALSNSKAAQRIQLGVKLTRGRGAGNKPEIGMKAAEENHEEILESLKGADMIFVTAGMGGGTGTGAAPVVAKIARELGALVVGVVTKPFNFEGALKMQQALGGINNLRQHVDALVVVPNEKLLELENNGKQLSMWDSFQKADEILKTGVQSISDLITIDGYMNLDFADVKTILEGAGIAHLAVAHGSGKEKVDTAADQIISSPLLETSISGARRLLLYITMSKDISSSEVDALTSRITGAANSDVIFKGGIVFDEEMQDEIKVIAIAADFDDDEGIVKIDNPLLGGGLNVLSNGFDTHSSRRVTQGTTELQPSKPLTYDPKVTQSINDIFDDIFNN